MTTEADLRDASARRAALDRYARAHARHDEAERFLRGLHMHERATERHGAALYAIRAWRAEQDNPEPKEPA